MTIFYKVVYIIINGPKYLFRKVIRNYYKYKVIRNIKEFQEPLTINGPSFVSNNTILGKNVNFNGIEISGCGVVQIGDNFHSGKNCQIISEIHNYSGLKLPYDEEMICKDVVIGNNVWLGNNVIILAGAVIGDGAIIQAGSTVVNEIPKLGIAGGHPAKVFKFRDKSHYDKLIAEKLFH